MSSPPIDFLATVLALAIATLLKTRAKPNSWYKRHAQQMY